MKDAAAFTVSVSVPASPMVVLPLNVAAPATVSAGKVKVATASTQAVPFHFSKRPVDVFSRFALVGRFVGDMPSNHSAASTSRSLISVTKAV